MVFFMAFGPKFFGSSESGIEFSPDPKLPKEWFSAEGTSSGLKNTVSVRLFGVPVVYVNPKKKNTFGPGGVKPWEYEWILDGRFYKYKGRQLPGDASVALREGRLESLTIFLN